MPFVPVPKDLAKVKTKVAFNLTKRQIVCFGAGGLVGVPAYIFTRGSIGNNLYAALSRQTKEVSAIENKTAGKAGKKPASGKKGTEKRKV